MGSRDRITGPDAIAACRRTAEEMLGKVIDRVRYVGLSYDTTRPTWDFGGWHWPHVGVEMWLASHGPVHAIWSWRATQFHLQLADGGLDTEWTPLRDDPEHANVWDVTGHPSWHPLVGTPIVAASLALGLPDDPPVEVPVAVKLYTIRGSAWPVAGAPKEWDRASAHLGADDVWLGHDEVIVVFDDAIAERIGLVEAVSIESPPEPIP
jgi:hypothetical protein